MGVAGLALGHTALGVAALYPGDPHRLGQSPVEHGPFAAVALTVVLVLVGSHVRGERHRVDRLGHVHEPM
jgi:hypothetical protein